MQTGVRELALALCALGTAGCSAQVDSDYRGESLGALKVALVADANDTVPTNTAIGLIWDLMDPAGFDQVRQFGELIDVTGVGKSALVMSYGARASSEAIGSVLRSDIGHGRGHCLSLDLAV